MWMYDKRPCSSNILEGARGVRDRLCTYMCVDVNLFLLSMSIYLYLSVSMCMSRYIYIYTYMY